MQSLEGIGCFILYNTEMTFINSRQKCNTPFLASLIWFRRRGGLEIPKTPLGPPLPLRIRVKSTHVFDDSPSSLSQILMATTYMILPVIRYYIH